MPQRSKTLLTQIEELKKQGMTDNEIATGLGMNSNQYRQRRSIANADQKIADAHKAMMLEQKGYSNVKIGEIMGRNESSIRDLLKPGVLEKASTIRNISNMLKDELDTKPGYVDIGVQTEQYIGIKRTQLKTAVRLLEEEGYVTHEIPIDQQGTGKITTMLVVAKPGTTWAEVMNNKDKIHMINDKYSEDGGRTILGIETPNSISSKRVKINYADDGSGGKEMDGVIQLRMGVPELSLGSKRYAQVRIAVDDTHYLKGMAIYTDKLPPGIDVMYNSNKSKTTPASKVFKSMADEKTGLIDPDNPFGATIRQKHFVTEEGKKTPGSGKMLELKNEGKSYSEIAKIMKIPEDLVKKSVKVSALNIVNEEGDWEKWSKNISSQMLSKQTPDLAKQQLGLAYASKKKEFDEIMTLTNPTVRKKLLDGFSDDCDSAAVHLKAAALPRQGSRVILPIPSMKDTEIYAPTYRNGEKVVLVRYPHGGIFEIPELTVNNQQPIAKKLHGKLIDAVGIHPKVAERLSGADFDGDTVLVIPNRGRNGKPLIRTEPALKQLEDFDPKALYKLPDSAPKMSSRTKGIEMGNVSNLITDMTIKGAKNEEIVRAVKHSMVVIDAEKHHLDYKQSAIDNGIAALKKTYQGGAIRGASTLISKASSDYRVDDRVIGTGNGIINPKTGKEKRIYIDPVTGNKLYTNTGKSYIKKTVTITDPETGKKKILSVYNALVKKALLENPNLPIKETVVTKTIKSTKMAEAKDAFELSSGTTMETVYAEHANKLKALANESRKAYISTPPSLYSASAAKTYAKEVATLNAKLNVALKNAPLERNANRIAGLNIAAKKAANPDMELSEIKKYKYQALAEARARMGAKKDPVEITNKEWEAIQAGAVSNNTLSQILNNASPDLVKQLATPRVKPTVTTAQESRMKNLIKSGHTQAEIADELGVSTSTVSSYMN
jgi:DNA-binding CsgD family transcriptional regulator